MHYYRIYILTNWQRRYNCTQIVKYTNIDIIIEAIEIIGSINFGTIFSNDIIYCQIDDDEKIVQQFYNLPTLKWKLLKSLAQ